MGKQAGVAHRQICQTPDDKSGGGGNHHRAPQHEKRAVKDRAHNDLANLRLAIGGQFQGEGGGESAQKRDRE